jgi:Protein of unknown function (DUF4240)
VAGAFWEVIDQAGARAKSCAECARALESILSALPSTEIEAFAQAQEDLMRSSYRWDLWGAAFVINGGCSDDGFDYFRGWLMLQGRDVWEAALSDPESLAGVSLAEDPECEDVLYAASKAYEQVAGHSLPPSRDQPPEKPIGAAWQESDLAGLYPKLWKRFAAEGAQGQARDSDFGDTWDRQMATGMALLTRGAFESAAQTFAVIRQKAPRQTTRLIATNNLAWTDLMIGTSVAVKEALGLANEVMQAVELEPHKANAMGFFKGTLAFALIKNGEHEAGLALIEEVLANEKAGRPLLAIRLCIRAIGLARTGELDAARSVIGQARKADPQCQLLTQAAREVVGPTIAVPQELQGLAQLVHRFGISDDLVRESVLKGSSNDELIALVNAVTTEMFGKINQFLEQTLDAEGAVAFGDLAQAAMEAKLELKLRGVNSER